MRGRRPVIPVLFRLVAVAVALIAFVSIPIARTASNPTPATRVSDTTDAITADTLKPSQCSGISLTSLVTGSGTFGGAPGAVNELILGSGGADTISADGGDDCVLAGGGADVVYAAAGNDVVLAGAGGDHVEGEGGDDTLYGGADYDVCLGGTGSNTVVGCEQAQVVEILDAWTTGPTHTVSAGTDRLLGFIVGAEHNTSPIGSVSSVTWGGQSLTKIDHAVETGSTAYENRLEMWYLNESGIAAASGSTFIVTWSGTTPSDQLYDAVTLQNVDQTTSVSAFSNNNAAAANTVQISSALTVADGDMVVYGAGSGAQGETHTPSSGYTEAHEQDSGGSGQVLSQGTKAIGPSPASEQPTATWSGPANNRLVIVAAVINAASGTPASATVSGTITPSAAEADIVAGGKTIVITLSGDTWDATIGADNAKTTALINGIDSAQAEANGWDAVVKANMDFNDVTRTSGTVVTVTLGAEAGYDITANETITVTVPATALVIGASAIVAVPTFSVLAASATVGGTVAPSATEAEIVAGGETIVITLTNETWVAAGAAFDAVRQDIIDGLDSAGAESTGWNAEVRDKQGVAAVVRTTSSVVTITLDAQSAYNVSAVETITMTVPASAVSSAGAIAATPTFDVTAAAISAAVTGTITPSALEAEIVTGGKAVIVTLTNEAWVAAGGMFDAIRQDIIDGLNSAQSEATGWNNEVRDKQGVAGVIRTSDTIVTITLDAQAAYDVTGNETITMTVPATAVVGIGAIVATPTFEIVTSAPYATVSGTITPSVVEGDIVAGGETIIVTLTNATWDATIGQDNALTTALIAGIDSAQAEANGWDAVVKANMDFNDVTRTSGTVVTVTLGAESTYDITAAEAITVTAPAATHSGSGDLTATPTFTVNAASATVSGTATPSAGEEEVRTGGETIVITLTNGTWVAVGATFDAQRQNIINGLDSAQMEATGWNAEVRDKQGVGGVVRTSDTAVTITLDAQAAYNVTADETITVTVPASAIVSAGAITATPTFGVVAVVPISILDAWTTGLTHTVSAGTDRLLLFVVGAEHNASPIGSVSSLSWGGQSLTKIDHAVETGSTAWENRIEMWYLDDAGIAAASGSTFIVTWSGTAPQDELYDAVTLQNVDQTTPVSAFSNNNAAGANTVQISSALTVADGDMVAYGAVSGAQGETHTPSGGYTEAHEQDSGGNGMVLSQGTRVLAAAGSEQPTATWSGPANNRLAIVGAALNVAP